MGRDMQTPCGQPVKTPRSTLAIWIVGLVLLTIQTVNPHLSNGGMGKGDGVTAERSEEIFRTITANQTKILENLQELTRAITSQTLSQKDITAAQARTIDRIGDLIDELRDGKRNGKGLGG